MSDDEEKANKPICRYGEKCYRKNPDHFRDFDHSKAKESKKTKTEDTKIDDGSPPKKVTKHNFEKVDDNNECSTHKSADAFDSEALFQCPTMSTLDDRKKFIKDRFLFEMPDDFYLVWKLAVEIKREDPLNAFELFKLELVGPFRVLAKKFDGGRCVKFSDFLHAYRYFYDVPEFQTIVVGEESSLFHIGYFRDDPNEFPSMVCSNEAKKGCKLTILGDNLLAALNHHMISTVTSVAEELQKDCQTIIDRLETIAGENSFSLNILSAKVKDRKRKVVAATFHGAGIVVPVAGDVGYRSIGETDANLKKMLKIIEDTKEDLIRQEKLEKIQELITYVQFANDECDYGMGLELGVDMFCSGCTEVHGQVYQVLSVAYDLLKRDKFTDILKTHLQNRSKNSVLKL